MPVYALVGLVSLHCLNKRLELTFIAASYSFLPPITSPPHRTFGIMELLLTLLLLPTCRQSLDFLRLSLLPSAKASPGSPVPTSTKQDGVGRFSLFPGSQARFEERSSDGSLYVSF